MIGKPVVGEELANLLKVELEKKATIDELNAELKAMKSGECLSYPIFVGTETGFSLVVQLSHVEGLLTVERPGKVYVYKVPKT